MSKYFNLLLLSKSCDVHPRSWICVSGKDIEIVINKMEGEIKSKNGLSRETLSKIISKKFNCSHNVIKTVFQGKKKFYPIPFILELIKLCDDKDYYTKLINSKITYLKTNSASSKPVNALKSLNICLAKIVGAFMADGSLSYQIIIASKNKIQLRKIHSILTKLNIKFSSNYSTSRNEFYVSFFPNYRNFDKVENLLLKLNKYHIQIHPKIEIIDGYKDTIEFFNQWVENCFNIKPTKFEKRQNAWRSIFSNKIFARYLITYFDIKPGYKSDIVFEPNFIKRSLFKLRRNFALGVITFDGSATAMGIVRIESKSKNLIDSLESIFKKDGIKFYRSTSLDNTFIISTARKNDPYKLLRYFEKRTIKWIRLKESYLLSKITDISSRYKEYKHTKVKIDKLLEVLYKIKSCDIEFLSKYFDCSHFTVSNYVRILKNNGKIKLTNNPKNLDLDFINQNVSVLLVLNYHNYLFNKIKENFSDYKEFSNFIGVKNGTLSSWKMRKNRIPISMLIKIHNVLNVDKSKICEHIEETDKKIIEVI